MRGEILAVLGRTSYEASCHCPLRGETRLLEVELMAWWEESQYKCQLVVKDSHWQAGKALARVGATWKS